MNTFESPPLDRKFRYSSSTESLLTKLYHFLLFSTIVIQSLLLLALWEKGYYSSAEQPQPESQGQSQTAFNYQCKPTSFADRYNLSNADIFMRIKYLVLGNMAAAMIIQGILFDCRYSQEKIRSKLEIGRLLLFKGIYLCNRFLFLPHLDTCNHVYLLLFPSLRNHVSTAIPVLPLISSNLLILISSMDIVCTINLILIFFLCWDAKIPTNFIFSIRNNEVVK